VPVPVVTSLHASFTMYPGEDIMCDTMCDIMCEILCIKCTLCKQGERKSQLCISIYDEYEVGEGGASGAMAGLLHPLTPRGKMMWLGQEGFDSRSPPLHIHRCIYTYMCIQMYRYLFICEYTYIHNIYTCIHDNYTCIHDNVHVYIRMQ